MASFLNFFRKKRPAEVEVEQLLALAEQLRQINEDRSLNTDVRLRMVSSIAGQASDIMRNSTVVPLHK
ncbi:hypothetical protein PAECIP111802_04968 [Paenibacillus allorhizosphaerae]|uniref:Cell division topological specificity factor n=1 Tax=Paenibacillus allorhizosphaerae TaxID=2849866 RepID=A0ABM8VNG8_9BACL|nr:hypothetical protein PAECIP111802_04968 [Paenibacillus allorhizosphaerae]